MAGLPSTTAAGLARRFTGPQWTAVETGVARVTERVFTLLPVTRQARQASSITLPQWQTVEVIFLALCRIANVDSFQSLARLNSTAAFTWSSVVS